MIPLGGKTVAVFHAVTQMRHVNDVHQSLVVDDPLGLLAEYRRQVARIKLRIRQSDNGKVRRRTADGLTVMVTSSLAANPLSLPLSRKHIGPRGTKARRRIHRIGIPKRHRPGAAHLAPRRRYCRRRIRQSIIAHRPIQNRRTRQRHRLVRPRIHARRLVAGTRNQVQIVGQKYLIQLRPVFSLPERKIKNPCRKRHIGDLVPFPGRASLATVTIL